MGNTVATAKARLRVITFEDWKERIAEALSQAGLKPEDFPRMPWQRFYDNGHTAGRVAEVVVASYLGVLSKSKVKGN